MIFNAIICLGMIVLCRSEDCLKKVLFSTKTPYKLVQNLNTEIQYPSELCKAVHINMVHRHGHRYPSANDMKKMKSFELKLKGTSFQWKSPFSLEQDKILTNIGENELFDLGKRIHIRFPELFTKYIPYMYKFQSSCKLRCTHSSASLASGLFHKKGFVGEDKYQPIALETFPCESDKILRFFDHCEKYVKKVDDNPESRSEMMKFIEGPQVKVVIEKVKRKLGYPDLELKPNNVKAMFLICAYEIAMFGGNRTSGICSLLDDDDIRALEYIHDQKNYYTRSAAYKINYKSSCPLLMDIIDTLSAAIYNSSATTFGIFRSAHAETIMPLYTLLGLFPDPIPLSSENYEHLKTGRKFRGACFSPFSGNVYFVLFNCVGTYKVQLYVNERLVKIPCCKNEYDCEFEVFVKCYQEIIDKCHFYDMCKLANEEL